MEQKLLDYFGGDELAANTWHSKYKVKEFADEITPDDMHQRMASEFARKEMEYQDTEINSVLEKGSIGLSDFGRKHFNEVTKQNWGFRDMKSLVYSYFKDFKYIVPQGSIMSNLGNQNQIGSLSNCFVIGQPYDSYGGIIEKDEQLAQLMKRRGGVGIDLSTLRPSEARVNNAAKTSTGVPSFMERYSNTTNEVAQGGRRGALMESLDCRHPDLFGFIKSKADKTKITGANISVRLRNDFMEAVMKDEDYILRFPCETVVSPIIADTLPYDTLICLKNIDTKEDIYYRKIKAKEAFESIIYHAWLSGDPGLMFVDNHWDFSPDSVYEKYKGVTTNPCGEIFMQMYDACRLLALNYFSFISKPFTDDAQFDFVKLYEVAYMQQRFADTLIDLEVEHIDRIIESILAKSDKNPVFQRELNLWKNIKETALASRRTGCGFTGLGDAVAAMGFAYDSQESIELIEGISKIKMQAELDCVIDLAILRGTFKDWDRDTEFAWKTERLSYGRNPFYQMLIDEFPEQAKKMYQYGRRNVSWSTVAPTGTVSLMTQTTSGIEPLFLPYYTRRKKINPNDANYRVDFTDDEGVQWQEFPVLHPKFADWIGITHGLTLTEIETFTKSELQEEFEESPWFKSTANDIDWHKRIQIQAIVQKYTTHSISSTINLPNDCKQEDIDIIYREAFEKGLKGITVYRDGSKYGVLVTNENSSTNKGEVFERLECNAETRPQSLPAEVHVVMFRGQSFVVAVGLLNSKPYEVFAYPCGEESNTCPVPGLEYTIDKDSSGKYSLHSPSEDNHSKDGSDDAIYLYHTTNIVENMSDEQEAITRLISASLRYNAELSYIVEQLDKANGDITSFTKAISRVLKKYIPTQQAVGQVCGDCSSTNLRVEEGCVKCNDCGSSRCG